MAVYRCVISVCSTLIVATGMWRPVQPHIDGEQYLEGYETVSTNPEDFEGQTVLILGQLTYCLLTELVI